VDLEQQNPVEEPVHQQDQVSTTDPDSTYATKGGTPAGFRSQFPFVCHRKHLTVYAHLSAPNRLKSGASAANRIAMGVRSSPLSESGGSAASTRLC
jgi:hypothetical protein